MDSTVVIVILGDEGDTSRRIPNGSADVTPYLDAFEQFERNIKIVSLGPNLVPDDDGLGYSLPCNNGGSTDWAAKRLLDISGQTKGFYRYLEEEIDGECALSDFAVHLDKLGDLLNNLDTSFQLATIPTSLRSKSMSMVKSSIRLPFWMKQKLAFPRIWRRLVL